MIQIVPIQKKHIAGFRQTVDRVAREGKYLLLLKAPSLKSTKNFVGDNIRNKYAQFVALDGPNVIGWCDIVPYGHSTTRHVGKLGMGVLPEYRGKGVGTLLIQACLRRARAKGTEIVHLDVYRSNKKAIKLYQKFKFKVDGVRKKTRKYQGRYEDLVLMSKSLRS